jgi:hypothetical protein
LWLLSTSRGSVVYGAGTAALVLSRRELAIDLDAAGFAAA